MGLSGKAYANVNSWVGLPYSTERQTQKGKERGRKGEEREGKGKLALTECKP